MATTSVAASYTTTWGTTERTCSTGPAFRTPPTANGLRSLLTTAVVRRDHSERQQGPNASRSPIAERRAAFKKWVRTVERPLCQRLQPRERLIRQKLSEWMRRKGISDAPLRMQLSRYATSGSRSWRIARSALDACSLATVSFPTPAGAKRKPHVSAEKCST